LLEAIFGKAWDRLGASLGAAVERADSPTAKLRALSEAMISALERSPDLGTLLFLEGRRIRRHGKLVLLSGGFLQLVELVDRLLLAMQEAGELKPGFDLQAVRSALIGALEGMLRDQLLAARVDYPAAFTAEDLRRSYEALLGGFLNR
jgi:hypothetical protein